MTIQPHALRATIELVLGCRPDLALIEDLAHTLDDPDEVLPWLILRQGLFANDPLAMAQLHTLAAAIHRTTPARPQGLSIDPEAQALERRLEQSLHDLIAGEIARSDLASEIGTLFDHRIAEPGQG
jgi:hypothetical protein